ncbi:hypothetical protein QFC21_000451 [Naganishia friedmannii]|uniref:Uncharacterized protein n=1 Tax=Naganishia friedmannii TaxID=89922 RepID=A0ACC2WCB5_9TREE|nr:hypothetical protein QFC21_000451 [Naganishia friedmannii]
MARSTSKNTGKGRGNSKASKKTSASTAPKRKAVQPSKSTKARSKCAREKSVDSDGELGEEEEIESAQEMDEEEEDETVEQSQEALEQVEPNFLETQQKDEMAELKARLEAKRMQKLRKTMNARVAQFDDIFEEAMGDIKKAENSTAAKDLRKKKQVFEDFITQSLEFQDAVQPENLEDIVDELKATSKEVGSVCRKFANKELTGFEDTLVETHEISEWKSNHQAFTTADDQKFAPPVAARPKRLAQAARDFRTQVAEEFNAIAEKTKTQLDAKKFMKAHFTALAKHSAA